MGVTGYIINCGVGVVILKPLLGFIKQYQLWGRCGHYLGSVSLNNINCGVGVVDNMGVTGYIYPIIGLTHTLHHRVTGMGGQHPYLGIVVTKS